MSSGANIQELVDKRVTSLEYLRNVGDVFWLNSGHLSKSEVSTMLADENKNNPLNAANYYYLGGSIPSLIDTKTPTLQEYLVLLLRLLKEYQSLKTPNEPVNKPKITSSVTSVGRRLFKSRHKTDSNSIMSSSSVSSSMSSNSIFSSSSSLSSSSNSEFKSRPSSFVPYSNSNSKKSGSIMSGSTPEQSDFSLLTVCHLPFTPDIHETFLSLCDMLIEAYKHIYTFSDQSSSAYTYEAYELLVVIDDLIKKDFISPTIQGIDMLSKSLIYEETTKLDGLLIHSK